MVISLDDWEEVGNEITVQVTELPKMSDETNQYPYIIDLSTNIFSASKLRLRFRGNFANQYTGYNDGPVWGQWSNAGVLQLLAVSFYFNDVEINEP